MNENYQPIKSTYPATSLWEHTQNTGNDPAIVMSIPMLKLPWKRSTTILGDQTKMLKLELEKQELHLIWWGLSGKQGIFH